MFDTWDEFAGHTFGAADAPLYCPLPDPDLLRATGEEAARFVDGQFINTLPDPGQAPRYNGYCSPGGRLYSTLMVRRDGDSLLLHPDPGLAEALLRQISKYILRAKVKIEAAPEHRAAGLIGQLWLPLLKDHDPRLILYRLPGPIPRLIALAPAAEPSLLESLPAQLPSPVHNASLDLWHAARIYAGVPQITHDTMDRFIPQHLNMDTLGGLSFNKGCYPGQEIITRLHHKGRQKTQTFTCLLQTDALPHPGATINLINDNSDPRPVGTLISATRLTDSDALIQALLPITTHPNAHLALDPPHHPLRFCRI